VGFGVLWRHDFRHQQTLQGSFGFLTEFFYFKSYLYVGDLVEIVAPGGHFLVKRLIAQGPFGDAQIDDR